MAKLKEVIKPIVNNAAARINVLAALADPGIKSVSFDQGGMSVRPSSFAEVAKAIEDTRIDVIVVEKLSSAGVYDAAKDRIELRAPEVNSITRKALVVHECLHAWMDVRALKNIKVKTSEAAAYLAQCIFARSKADDPKDEEVRLYSDDAKMDAVFKKAWAMAGSVVLHKKNPPAGEFSALEDLVAKTASYSHEANDKAKWNGVPKA